MTDLERKAREYATRVHPCKYKIIDYAKEQPKRWREVYEAYIAAAKEAEQEIAALKARLGAAPTAAKAERASRYEPCKECGFLLYLGKPVMHNCNKGLVIEAKDAEIAALRARVAELEGMVPKWVGDAEHSRLLASGWSCGPDAIWHRPPGAIEAEWHWLMVPPIPLPEPNP